MSSSRGPGTSPTGVGGTMGGSNGASSTSLTCGNGVRDGLEECDEGTRNANTVQATCRTDCKVPFCGDGVVSPMEECDDGAGNDDLRAAACRTNCKSPRCGDGVIDEPGVDRCDEGASNSDTTPNACRTNCYVAKCGDGVRDVGETCDLGTANSDAMGDAAGCTTLCRSALCGNGQIDAGEECDDGAGNSDTVAGACRTSCQMATCGDGVIDPTETCDEGKNNSDTQPDKCRTNCVEATCGDGVKDSNEDCDGDEGCDGECKAAGCGDGVVREGVEECDDGVLTSEYGGCAAECRLAPHCGDGNTDEGFEECDDGEDNQDDTYGKCGKDCKLGERCGDGVVQEAEQCDGGSECNASCQFGACSSGQLRCGSEAMCVDPKTNGQFCGASGDCQGDNDGTTCPSNSQCTDGSCKCSNGGVICDSKCIDPKTDNYFCGASDNCSGDDKNGTPCATGTQCENGSCLPQCNSSQQRCGDKCIPKDACCEPDDCPSTEMTCTDQNVCECTGDKVTCGDGCLPAGQCCDDDDCESGEACRNSACVESDPPGVSRVSPSDGQTGVLYNAEIVLTFDEAMDTASVQAATTLTGFNVPGLAFSWNSAGTEVRITSTAGLTYKSGTNPSEAPYTYVLSVGTGAKDRNGNALQSAFTSDFSTRRNIKQDFPATVAVTNTYGPAISTSDVPRICSGSSLGSVGWWTSPGNGGQYYVFASINATSLLNLSGVEIIEATFNGNQGAASGDFYTGQAGTVELALVLTQGTTLTYRELYQATVIEPLDTFASNDAPVLEKDITARFEDDFNSDLMYMVFRLAYGKEPPNNAKATFECGSLKVVVTYSLP